jgi:hypothetical protein
LPAKYKFLFFEKTYVLLKHFFSFSLALSLTHTLEQLLLLSVMSYKIKGAQFFSLNEATGSLLISFVTLKRKRKITSVSQWTKGEIYRIPGLTNQFTGGQ